RCAVGQPQRSATLRDTAIDHRGNPLLRPQPRPSGAQRTRQRRAPVALRRGHHEADSRAHRQNAREGFAAAMSPREFTEEENKIRREVLRTDEREALKQSSKDEQRIAELRKLPRLEYEKRRKEFADEFGVRVGVLDRMVYDSKGDERDFLPHWNVEQWPE